MRKKLTLLVLLSASLLPQLVSADAKEDTEKKISQLQSQIVAKKEEQKALETKLKDNAQKRDSVVITIDEMTNASKVLDKENNELKTQREKLSKKIQKLEKKQAKNTTHTLNVQLASRTNELNNLQDTKPNGLDTAKAVLKTLDDESSKTQTAITEIQKATENLLSEKKQAESDLEKLKQKAQNDLNAQKATEKTTTSFLDAEDQALYNKVKDLADSSTVGLTPHVAEMKKFLGAKFGITSFSLYRPGDGGEHGKGLAIDLMVTGAKGDEIADYLVQNYSNLKIDYIIWEQKFYSPYNSIYGAGGTWGLMPDRGSITENHYDHVHISFKQ